MAWFDKDGVLIDDNRLITWGSVVHAKSWKQGQ